MYEPKWTLKTVQIDTEKVQNLLKEQAFQKMSVPSLILSFANIWDIGSMNKDATKCVISTLITEEKPQNRSWNRYHVSDIKTYSIITRVTLQCYMSLKSKIWVLYEPDYQAFTEKWCNFMDKNGKKAPKNELLYARMQI